MAPTGSFAHGEAVSPPPNALQAGEPLPLCNPGDPQTALPAPRALTSFLTGALLS